MIIIKCREEVKGRGKVSMYVHAPKLATLLYTVTTCIETKRICIKCVHDKDYLSAKPLYRHSF